MSTPMQSCTYMTPSQYIPHNVNNTHPSHPPPPPFYPGTGPQNYMVGCYPSNGWTGIPLISTAQRRPRRGVPIQLSRTQSLGGFDEQSISRLAIHAHGAPLISIGGRYGNNNNNRKPLKKDALRTLSLNEERSSYIRNNEKNVGSQGSSQSDENSQQIPNTNSGTNETCLPRIIKPRKRRKKDRKPNGVPTDVNQSVACQNNVNQLKQDNNQNRDSFIIENSSNNTSNSLPSSDICSCSCKLCDPFGKLWSITPLRRSCSDNSSDVVDEYRHTKDVGVIGGDRRVTNTRNEWRSLPQILPKNTSHNNNSNEHTRKSSLSDSGDSGCAADILSGLNITDDLLAVGRDLFASSTDTNIQFQLPQSSSALFCTNNNNIVNSGNKYHENINNNNNNNDSIHNQNHIETNLNELTRQLSETLDLKSDGGLSSSDSGSVLSDSVFSDGVPDLFVNFDSISKNQLFSANNISKLSNLLFVEDDNLTSPALVQISPPAVNHRQQSENNNNLTIFNNLMNNNNNNYDNNLNNNKNCNGVHNINHQQLITHNGCYDQPFIFIPDKDRSSEIFNCFDMVWNGIQQN